MNYYIHETLTFIMHLLVFIQSFKLTVHSDENGEQRDNQLYLDVTGKKNFACTMLEPTLSDFHLVPPTAFQNTVFMIRTQIYEDSLPPVVVFFGRPNAQSYIKIIIICEHSSDKV